MINIFFIEKNNKNKKTKRLPGERQTTSAGTRESEGQFGPEPLFLFFN